MQDSLGNNVIDDFSSGSGTQKGLDLASDFSEGLEEMQESIKEMDELSEQTPVK